MGLDRRLLDILCCPVSKQPLKLLNARQLDVVKRAQQAGTLKRSNGEPVTDAPDGGLLTRDGKAIYLIVDGIPVMLADEAVPTAQFEAFPS